MFMWEVVNLSLAYIDAARLHLPQTRSCASTAASIPDLELHDVTSTRL